MNSHKHKKAATERLPPKVNYYALIFFTATAPKPRARTDRPRTIHSGSPVFGELFPSSGLEGLEGESGVELAIDTACQCSASILLIVPGAIYAETIERVADFGILVIEKPFPVLRLNRAMHFLSAQQTRLQKLEEKVRAAEEKVQEIMLVDKAKFFLMEHRHMTEAEAHRYIGKQAMDHGMSRKRIAQEILDGE